MLDPSRAASFRLATPGAEHMTSMLFVAHEASTENRKVVMPRAGLEPAQPHLAGGF